MPLNIIILCGGKGNRIRSVLGDIPKVLAPINDKVFLDYIFFWLKSSFADFPIYLYLSTGIGHSSIEDYIHKFNIECTLSREEHPLGTFGAVIEVVQGNNISGDLLVVNGDTIFDLNFKEAYRESLSLSPRPLLVVKKDSKSSRYGGYDMINGELKLTNDNPKYISLGAFFCPTALIMEFSSNLSSEGGYLMLDRDFLTKAGTHPYVIPQHALFIDIGIPSDYAIAQTLIPSFFTL